MVAISTRPLRKGEEVKASLGAIFWEQDHGIPFVPETRQLPPAPKDWRSDASFDWGDNLIEMVSIAMFPISQFLSDGVGQTFPVWNGCWTLKQGDFLLVFAPAHYGFNPTFPDYQRRDNMRYAVDWGWLDLNDKESWPEEPR